MLGRFVRTDPGARSTVLAITLLACALRAVPLLSQGLWRDEVDALLFATRPLPQLLDMFRQPGQNGPLFFLLLRPWLALSGHSEFALRFPAMFFGILSVPLLYILLTRASGPVGCPCRRSADGYGAVWSVVRAGSQDVLPAHSARARSAPGDCVAPGKGAGGAACGVGVGLAAVGGVVSPHHPGRV